MKVSASEWLCSAKKIYTSSITFGCNIHQRCSSFFGFIKSGFLHYWFYMRGRGMQPEVPDTYCKRVEENKKKPRIDKSLPTLTAIEEAKNYLTLKKLQEETEGLLFYFLSG